MPFNEATRQKIVSHVPLNFTDFFYGKVEELYYRTNFPYKKDFFFISLKRNSSGENRYENFSVILPLFHKKESVK